MKRIFLLQITWVWPCRCLIALVFGCFSGQIYLLEACTVSVNIKQPGDVSLPVVVVQCMEEVLILSVDGFKPLCF
jgi:hypothetical protein